jgi:DNA-binding transcriptional regulator LsrR (DeoR family)
MSRMLQDDAGGPAELVLMASVARRYFLEGLSKVEIAEQSGLSRFKVARLLERARASGMVRIEIGYPGSIDVDLSSRLQNTLGLRHALVLTTAEEQPAALLPQLGTAAAQLLTEILTPSDVLGLGGARSVNAMGAALTRLPPCEVVQLTGALPGMDVETTAVELVRAVARIGGGPAYFYHAPMIVAGPLLAQALRQQPEVARARSRLGAVTTAVVGIGSWDPPYSLLYDAIEPAERASLVGMGVRADVSGVLLDGQGRPVHAPLSERTITPTAQQLIAVPEVIAIAYAAPKAGAVLAAIRGGLVGSLVTHRPLAEAVLRLAVEPVAGSASVSAPASPPDLGRVADPGSVTAPGSG